jgi:hypothetical protein
MIVSKSQNVPIYATRLHIVVTNDLCKDKEEINRRFHQNFGEDFNSLGLSEERGGHLFVLINVAKHKKIFKKDWDVELVATITHESVHLCNMLFKVIGAKTDLKNDESQAYLTDWFAKEIYKLTKKI